MLPQGEFRKLLTSETENKEDILRRLFKTEPYKQISERLRSKKDQVAESFQQERQTRDTYIQHIHATLPNRGKSLVFQVLADDYYNVNQVLAGLEEEVTFYQNQITLDQEKYEKAYTNHDRKQTAFHQAKVVNERFEELKQKETVLQELNAQVAHFQAKEKQLADSERAARMEPYEKQVAEARQDEQKRTKTLQTAEQNKQTADIALKRMEAAYQEEENKKDDREKVSEKLNRLKEYLPTVKEMEARKNKIGRAH